MQLTQEQLRAADAHLARGRCGRDALAKAVGCSTRQAQNYLDGVYNKRPGPVKAAPTRDDFAGVKGFAALHSPEARQRRRDDATAAAIAAFIAGPLKQRGWYYDMEAARVAGVGSQDWARFRDQYSHLHVVVRGDGRDKLCWCHPDTVEDMRAIAEGRKTV